MPWYYAGPEAKPVGPVTLEELQARHLIGVVAPETYVIETPGRAGESREWKRYRDLFPGSAATPPLPPPPPLFYPAPATLPPVPAHPLFPSAGATTPPLIYAPHGMPHPHALPRPTNALCLWGFILGLGGLFFSVVLCGTGFLPALPGFFMSLVGLIQVQKDTARSGRGLAIWGMVLSAMAILITLIILFVFIMPKIQSGDWTNTEQTTNDSD